MFYRLCHLTDLHLHLGLRHKFVTYHSYQIIITCSDFDLIFLSSLSKTIFLFLLFQVVL